MAHPQERHVHHAIVGSYAEVSFLEASHRESQDDLAMPVRPTIASSMNTIEKMNREKLGAIEAESEVLDEVATDKDEEESDGEEVRHPMKWW